MRTGLPRLLFAAALPYRNHLPSFQRVRPFSLCATSPPSGFAALGLNPLLLPALTSLGIEEPTEVQRAAFEMLLGGNDAVLLSETGTGKTLAYALPLVHRLIDRVQQQADEAAPIEDDTRPSLRRTPESQALILVPNRELAAQVHGVVSGIVASLPDELQPALRVSSLAAEYGADVDATILISTPALALKLWRGPEPIRWVVLDEADALLAGSWKVRARMNYPIEQIVSMVKRTAKLEARDSYVPLNTRQSKDDKRASGRKERAELFYKTKQFVITGATMPNAGTKNMEEHVKRLFPSAEWFMASRVHRSVAAVKQFFVKIDPESRGDALQQALKHGPDGKVLVFANTLEMATAAYEDAKKQLGADGCGFFHAGLPPNERAAALADFENGSPNVLVCTGLASRGIDFVDVAHVVQYDVAHNAVEFMHRVGRTARAGKSGVATTLYTDDRADLIEGLRDALAEGKPIDHLFSRKRSFSLQIKKRRKRAEGAEMRLAAGDEEVVERSERAQKPLRRVNPEAAAERRARMAEALDERV